MKYEWDEQKRRANIQKHGVDFNIIERFDWDMAKVLMDDRFHYDEARFAAYSFIANKIHCLIFTPRNDIIRVISLRKANRREVRDYESG